MDILRICKHLFYSGWLVRRAFPNACQDAIAHAIHTAEGLHAGEIRFVLIDGPSKATVRGAPDALVRSVIDACCQP
jgi:3-dehydroquinate synthase